MIVEPDNTPGYELVRRVEGEPCVAVIHHPKGSRRWHVTYRAAPGDFRCHTPNVSCATRKAALAEIEHTIAICSDYQLGLATTP